MAGTPVRHERKRAVNAAFELVWKDRGVTPEEGFKPMVEAQIRKAEEGDTAAYCAVRDTVDGRPTQYTKDEDAGQGRLVSHALLASARELLKRIPKREPERVENVIEVDDAAPVRSDQG